MDLAANFVKNAKLEPKFQTEKCQKNFLKKLYSNKAININCKLKLNFIEEKIKYSLDFNFFSDKRKYKIVLKQTKHIFWDLRKTFKKILNQDRILDVKLKRIGLIFVLLSFLYAIVTIQNYNHFLAKLME
jgi:hypothetical protein